MGTSPVYFVHIGDTHIGATTEFAMYGVNAYASARQIVATINALPTQPHFVMHTGDIVAHPDPAAYALAREIFCLVRVPIYFAVGNHDTARAIHEHLVMGERDDFSADTDTLSYAFTRENYRFLTLDARGPDEIDPGGMLATSQFDFLEREIRADDKRLVLFIHFPPLPLDSVWYDESMLLLNGESLHRMLVPVRDRVCGVFFGHVHRGIQILRDGILYSSVASTVGQFLAHPSLRRAEFDLHHPPCFNVVTLKAGETIIKEYSIQLTRSSDESPAEEPSHRGSGVQGGTGAHR